MIWHGVITNPQSLADYRTQDGYRGLDRAHGPAAVVEEVMKLNLHSRVTTAQVGRTPQ